MVKKYKQLLFIFVGAAIMSLSSHFFLIPSQLASGGVSGLAIVINYIIPSFPIGILVTILNLILFILGFLILGKEFGILTVYGTLLFSLLLIIMENIMPLSKPIVDDLLVNVFVGASMMALGLAIVIGQEASTGGTDIIAMILNKIFHIDLGHSFLIADSSVLIFAIMVMGIEKGIYSTIATVIISVLVDKFVAGFNNKLSITIISDQVDEINSFINNNLDRGTTLYPAIGGYTKNDRYILVTIVGKKEYIKIKEYVNKMDPEAFMFIKYTTEVIGEGFTREKVR